VLFRASEQYADEVRRTVAAVFLVALCASDGRVLDDQALDPSRGNREADLRKKVGLRLT
jgi:hypothetical protein